MHVANEDTLKISPYVRIAIAFDDDLNRDSSGYYTEERYLKLIGMVREAETRRDKVLKSVLMFDALLIILSTGRSLTIPGIDIPLSQLPAITEISTFLATAAAFFTAVAMINWHCYSAMVQALANRIASADNLDPDFVRAPDVFIEFTEKAFRRNLKHTEVDVLQPGKSYNLVRNFLNAAMLLFAGGLLVFHLIAVSFGLWSTFISERLGWIAYPYSFVFVLLNAVVCFAFVLPTFSFMFRVHERKESANEAGEKANKTFANGGRLVEAQEG